MDIIDYIKYLEKVIKRMQDVEEFDRQRRNARRRELYRLSKNK